MNVSKLHLLLHAQVNFKKALQKLTEFRMKIGIYLLLIDVLLQI